MEEISSEMHKRDLQRSNSTIAFSGQVVFELVILVSRVAFCRLWSYMQPYEFIR